LEIIMSYSVYCNHGIPQCGCEHKTYDTEGEALDAAQELIEGDARDIMDSDPDMGEDEAEELAATYTTIVREEA
jgi:hypothetical protein